MHIFPNEFDEAKWIVIDIKERHYLQGSKWGEHMVLVRSSFAARHIEAACIAANVPYRFIGGMKLLETAHVKICSACCGWSPIHWMILPGCVS